MKTSFAPSFSPLNRILLGSATLLFALPVGAATITWGTVSNITSDSDVSTAGTLVAAYNIGADTTTVNGVEFVGTGNSGSAAGIAAIGFPGTAFTSAAAPTGSPFDLLSSNYKTLVGSGGYVGYDNGNFNGTFELGGLIVGHTYSFQVWANDSRGTNSPDTQADIASRTSIFSGTVSATLFQNVGGAGSDNYAGGLGQTVIGTFVADSASQSVGTTAYALLNAYQLRDTTASAVPEPSTYAALVGALALGFVAARRRTRVSAA